MPSPRYRRRWIKLWVQETLYGTLSKELTALEQSVWFKPFALGGDSPAAGKICVAKDIPYTDDQLSKLFNVDIETLIGAEEELLATERIHYSNDVICITNWEKYQGEYERLRKWREKHANETKKETPHFDVSTETEKAVTNVTCRGRGRGEEEDINTTLLKKRPKRGSADPRIKEILDIIAEKVGYQIPSRH